MPAHRDRQRVRGSLERAKPSGGPRRAGRQRVDKRDERAGIGWRGVREAEHEVRVQRRHEQLACDQPMGQVRHAEVEDLELGLDAPLGHPRRQRLDGLDRVEARPGAEVQRPKRQACHVGPRVAVEEQDVAAAVDVDDRAAARRRADDDLRAAAADLGDELRVGLAPPVRPGVVVARVKVHDRRARSEAALGVVGDLAGRERDVRHALALRDHPGQGRVDDQRRIRGARMCRVRKGTAHRRHLDRCAGCRASSPDASGLAPAPWRPAPPRLRLNPPILAANPGGRSRQ